MKFSLGDVLVPKGKEYPDGALVADEYDDAGRLMAHSVGGGLQYYVGAEAAVGLRVVDDAERERALFRHGRFALADSGETFVGWSNGRLWKGWEMPRFERAAGELLLAWLGDGRARFEAERDAFVTVSQDGEDDEERGGGGGRVAARAEHVAETLMQREHRASRACS
jgi:hypothetical protein